MLPTKFRFICQSGFRGEDFLEINQSETRIVCPLGQMNRNLLGSIYGRSSIKSAHFVPTHLQTWPPQAILVSDGFRGEDFLEINQSETRIVCGVHVC
jgi:hypothetical protein